MEPKKATIEFYLNNHSGIAPYLQLVQQVKQALLLGFLKPGDQLPTMREVVAKVVINPNTVFKAYRTLELEGLVGSRPGQGTFILRTLADPALERHSALRQSLIAWLEEAQAAGLNKESTQALIESTVQQFQRAKDEDIA